MNCEYSLTLERPIVCSEDAPVIWFESRCSHNFKSKTPAASCPPAISKHFNHNIMKTNTKIMRLTPNQFYLIAHSLGVDYSKQLRKTTSKPRFLPKEYYRNYFYTYKTSDGYKALCKMEKLGIMESRSKWDGVYFFVTQKGIDIFESDFKNAMLNSESRLEFLTILNQRKS